ncbi:MAG TPA: histidine phosphatase family protein [Gemmatimonadaceae bacterium]|nr:histidine phosphatase family protein [Gemmatimonadaceae bacterium]
MTTFLLIRHAAIDAHGRAIAGRAPGVSLNAEGRSQARALAASLRGATVDAVYSSPLERAWETAHTIAEALGLQAQLSPSLQEIDFGEWTGRAFAELDQAPDWQRFNAFRSGTRVPGGEHMLEAQARAVGEIDRLRRRHAGGTVVVVSHGDILRAIVAWYIGLPLDLFQRLEIGPASTSTLEVTEDGARLLLLNAPPPVLRGVDPGA